MRKKASAHARADGTPSAPGGAAGTGRRGPGRQPLPPGFGALWSCVALDLVGFGIVLPLLPLYAERFGASAAVVGLLVSSFSVAQLALAPVWGRLSDRIGRKPLLVLSLIGTAVGSLLTGLAPGLGLLFLGRLVDGASGASVSVAQAAVADVAPPDQRARLFGLLGAAFGIGFIGGPALGALAALGDPRLPFFIAAAIAAANAVWAMRRLPETLRPVATGDRRAGVARLPNLWSSIGGPVIVVFVSLVAFSAFEATFSLFGERRLGFRLASAGAVFAVIGVLIAVVQVGLVGRAVARFGEAGTLRLGLVLNGAGLLVLTGVHSWLTLAPAVALLTVGQGLITPTLASTVAGRAPPGARGGALGVQQSAGGLGRVLGPVLGGYLFQHAGVDAPYLAGAALLALAALASASLPSIRSRAPLVTAE